MLRGKLKKHFFGLSILLIAGAFTACSGSTKDVSQSKQEATLIGDKSEEYYMVTFRSGIEYWKKGYKGFEESGRLHGVKTIYTGAFQYNVSEEVAALEQVIAKKPAGIAISCINPDAFKAPIEKAIAAGIPVVTFDADSPDSPRYSFLGTNNEYAGETAAKTLSDLIGNEGGEVVIITNPNQMNIEQRVAGFKNALEENYKGLKLVEVGNGKSDETEAAKLIAAFLQVHPNIKGIFCTEATGAVGAATAVREANKIGKIKIVGFDTDRGTLDGIKAGVISATIAQGTYNMGYQSMEYLFQVKHDLINPIKDWKAKGINPLPTFVDTGVSIITSKNVDSFYEK